MTHNAKKIDQVFLILTDKSEKKIIDFYYNLKNSTESLGTTILLYHDNNRNNSIELESLNKFNFKDDILTECGYLPIGQSLIPGNNHFPLLKFYVNFPNYDFYWVIEDDVYFNGNWSNFLSDFNCSEHDFIASHIRFYEEEPDWYWWDSLLNSDNQASNIFRLRSFNPIYRISNSALKFIHNNLLNRWQGHHEVLLPSLLYNSKYKIKDFGGTGLFVDQGSTNKYYVDCPYDKYGQIKQGTMRWRPYISDLEINEKKLYHPVKHYKDYF